MYFTGCGTLYTSWEASLLGSHSTPPNLLQFKAQRLGSYMYYHLLGSYLGSHPNQHITLIPPRFSRCGAGPHGRRAPALARAATGRMQEGVPKWNFPATG
eukprot:scaffold1423_cov314-Prasinococcus_capsulatus_cf.AAC.3